MRHSDSSPSIPPRFVAFARRYHPSTTWRARPRPRPLRALADQHVSRRVAGHGADRTGGLRRRDRWRELPRLHRPDLGADPAPRRHRHRRPTSGPTRSPASSGPSRPPGPHSGTCHPTARTSIPSSSASRSSRPSFAPLAVAAPRRSGRSSASAWRTSSLTNAATIFGTAGTRPPHGHEKRFNALGSVTPLAISRTICIPVRPVMSVITLWRWTFIRARDFCIRRM